MSRLENKFAELNKIKKKALIGFISAGDPDFEYCEKIMKILPKSGIDIVELGLPFSDPMADGPTIQRSSQRAIKSGFSLKKTFDMIKRFRLKDDKTPIVLMGYFNLMFQYGIANFFYSMKKFKVDGLIIVDLPPEENALLENHHKKNKIDIIRLITPTTDSKRLKIILKNASGFLYYVSIMGITGTKKPSLKKVSNAVSLIKKNTKVPIVVGFGINNKSQIKEISRFADGAVVGSSLVKIIEDSNKNKIIENLEKFIKILESSCYTN
ncbi:MAG: tryptophan synthase subunit alpha [Rickettsiales bacterium]|nr:tryptophan synthase subunit alpha [Rickettsiales bacterium]OUV54096.1 MAG: tryptophan synthase subunit alpha [Rickettsiales bacterium TMED127]|tara:strand:+ start:3203 stop:4003 length:801 start_codon:yes stop_codon:yes gene_type:complete